MYNITLSLVINYLALVIAVWLGWYVITRSPRSLVSWLTGLTLLSAGGLFLNILLALNPPPPVENPPGWLRVLFLFWPATAFEGQWVAWLQGWQVIPAIVFWHHATILMRSAGMNWWRWTRVIFGYLMALMAIVIQITAPLLIADISSDPMLISAWQPGPLFLPLVILLALFTILSLVNLIRSALAATGAIARRQLIILAFATAAAGLTAPVTFISPTLELNLTRTSLTLLLLISIVLIGYGVARYSALIEGRTIRRDFFYNALAMGLITITYSFVTWVSVVIYNVPAAAFVFVIMLAIITHNLVDVARRSLDSIFYRRENQVLRQNLRALASKVGEQDLDETIALALAAMCDSVRATYGAALLFEDGQARQFAAWNLQVDVISQPVSEFTSDDVIPMVAGQLPPPLQEAALLVPLYVDTTQIGAILLGRPINGLNYLAEDIEKLLYPSDRLAEAIHTARREEHYLEQLSEFTTPNTVPKKISTKEVERALRNLYDFALLGDTGFARLKLAREKLSASDVTHVDRGKAVYQVILDAIEKLRPDTEKPRDPPPREWHPYIILRGAYIEDKLNRDIMSQLYISEGTFNRTRRAAIRSLARILGEMEAAMQ